MLVTALSSAFMLSVPGGGSESAALPLLLVWFTLLTSFIAFSSLYEALDLAWSYQAYAVQQMSEAREHRASLMQITRALNETRQDLERANTQLSHAQRAAEEARRLKAQFAANVSHELRTPINLIVGFSETIVMSPGAYGVPMPPVYWADMHTIYRSAKHLQSLINDVLDVSQIEAGKMAIIKEETNARQVILEAASLQRDLIESRGLAFQMALPEGMPTLYLDRTRVRQVILNLLSNAARFTDNGTITLSARVEPTKLLVSVTDTGIGIPPPDLNRVFEEFHQLEGSLSRRRGGSGLGLTLCKQFVELHGGRIWAESVGIPGLGTTFTFTLPFIDQIGTPPHAADLLPAQAESEARYFVVLDKDPAILQLFERYTSKHKVVSVKEAEEAIRLVGRIRPAALVMDERNHQALLERLRAANDQTPLITCAMPSGRRGLHGDAAYFVKPVTGDTLRETLEGLSTPICNILIIGEDRDVIRMFTRMIQSMPQPYRVWKAYSAEEGLALMQQQHPDAVILDILTPNAEGLTLLQQISALPDIAAIPVIIASTANDIDELTPAPEGSIHVTKPSGLRPVELVRCIEALVDVFILNVQNS